MVPPTSENGRVLVVNPTSGSEEHPETVAGPAAKHGFAVRETEGAGDAVRLAAEAARKGASFVAAAGGDGTLNAVVAGLYEADALESVTFGVVPAGTGNNFASNIGVESIERSFEILSNGQRRTIDLGLANDSVFINSCVGGITADASAATTPESKRKLGVMAYVINTLKHATAHDGVSLTITTDEDSRKTWSGDAAFVLVGNGRRFPVQGRTQADMEDGLFEVTLIEDGPTADLFGQAALERLLGRSGNDIYRLRTPALTVTATDETPVNLSLDGEMESSNRMEIETLPGALTLPVGSGYDPDPGERPPAESKSP
jgi:YegS/Rv2252/BmrU family lipid kinase